MLDVLFNPLLLCWNPHGFADGRPETTFDPKPNASRGNPLKSRRKLAFNMFVHQSWIQQMILMPVMSYSPSELDANQPDLICNMMEYTCRYQYVPQTDIYRSIHPFIHSSIHLFIYPTPTNRYWEYTRSTWGSDLIYLRNKRFVPCHF